jgi:hypothetical protein
MVRNSHLFLNTVPSGTSGKDSIHSHTWDSVEQSLRIQALPVPNDMMGVPYNQWRYILGGGGGGGGGAFQTGRP